MVLSHVLSLEILKQEETQKKRKEKTTHISTIKENHFFSAQSSHSFFLYKSLVLLQSEHSGNMYALQYYSDNAVYLPYMKIM